MAELLIYLAVAIAALSVAWGLVYLWSRSYDRRYRLRQFRERLPMIELSPAEVEMLRRELAGIRK